MSITKVNINQTSQIDLTDKSVSVDSLGSGFTAHTSTGAQIIGSAEFDDVSDSHEVEIIERTISGTYSNNEITTLRSNAFFSCSSLTSVDLPNVSQIGEATFSGTGLVSFNIPNFPSSIPSTCFYSTSLTSVTMSVTGVGFGAFQLCKSLTYASFSNATVISNWAFEGCSALSQIYAPSVTIIGPTAFSSCYSLQSAYFPLASNVGTDAFNNCSALSSVYLPKFNACTAAGFKTCKSLLSLALPKCTNSPAMTGCVNLSALDLYIAQAGNTAGTGQGAVGGQVFQNCSALSTVVIRYPCCATGMANSNAFWGTPFSQSASGGTVYVWNRLISEYQSKTNWALFYGYGTMTFSAIESSPYSSMYADGTQITNWWDYEWDVSDGLLSENGWEKTILGTAQETLVSNGTQISSGGNITDSVALSSSLFDSYKNFALEIVVNFSSLNSSTSENTVIQIGTTYGGFRVYESGGNWKVQAGSVYTYDAVQTGVDYTLFLGTGGTPLAGGNPFCHFFINDVRMAQVGRNTGYKTTYIKSACQNGSTIIKSIKVKNLL